MKEIDEENRTLLRLKNESGHINGMLKTIKTEMEKKEKELNEKLADIENKERNIVAAKKEKEDAEKFTESVKVTIRKLEQKANKWKTDTKVCHIFITLIGSYLHPDEKEIIGSEKEIAGFEEEL